MTEREILIDVMKKDKKAFEQLVALYQTKALRTAFLICQNKDLAQDIVQESFVRCYLNINKLLYPEAFRSWFYKILHRTALEYIRREKKYLPVDTVFESSKEAFQDDLFDNYLEKQQYQRLKEAIQTLSIAQRTVLVMHYFNGMSIEEIAEATTSFQGTVKSRLFFARKKLKSVLYAHYTESRRDEIHEP